MEPTGRKLVKKVKTEDETVETKKEETPEATSEVVVRAEAGLPSIINFEEDMAGGFENVTSKDFRIPILRVLQSGSPEIDEDNPKFITGAKYGSLLNISTKEVYDGKEGVWLVPCGYHKKWVEFVPRDQGGGYVDEYEVDDPIVKKAVKAPKGTGKIIKETGNTLTETGYFPCIVVKADGTTDTVVLTVSSAAWNFAKDWLDVMRKKVIIKDGRPLPSPPAFWSHMYRIGSHSVKNSQYTWKQFIVLEDKKLSDKDVELYMAAREFNRISNSLSFGPDQNEEIRETNAYNEDSDEDSAY